MLGHAALPPAGEVHLFFAETEAIADPALVARYHGLLAPDEAARNARFVFARHRHEHLVTRALVRAVLSRYADVPPAAWRFRPGAHGRPEIDLAWAAQVGGSSTLPTIQSIRFNLSNTDGLVVCAVGRDREVGVDAEPLDRRVTQDVAGRYFASSEVAALRALPEEAQARRFLDYWTLKESYIKARGMGLAIPLEQFAFTLGAPPIRIAFDPALGDDPRRWRFAQLRPTARHLVAVAAEVRPDDPAAARPEAVVALARRVVPLVDVP